MGFIRFVKRNYRRWKYLLYFIGFICIIQIFALSSSDSSSLELNRLKQFHREELQRNHEAANALLQGGRSNDRNVQLNPKDPRFRNEFLQNVKDQNGIHVLEDKSLNDQNFQIPADPVNHFGKKPETDSNFKYHPVCEVTLKDAQSAISRAKSAQCKQEIADTACKMQEKDLFPVSMPRTCPHQSKFAAQAPMPKSFDTSKPQVRICFMLVVHGRSFRQFRRLLRVIYHRDHYYYIHVDARSDYLMSLDDNHLKRHSKARAFLMKLFYVTFRKCTFWFPLSDFSRSINNFAAVVELFGRLYNSREILTVTKQYPNVKVAYWRMATIWGGASLLQMLLRAMKDVLFFWRDWDFFINLSGLDFPIANNEKLVRFLSTYFDKNFMKSHGRDDDKFIRKQGLDRVFVECDQHMWRLGKRDLPNGIQVNGGSDWVALNRQFCSFAISGKSKLLDDLKYWYKYTLLPAESFFHTLVQNSDFCETFVDNNLRVTNWNRARGCKCQYKHIVDWCGCSPNDFFPSDLVRLQTSRPVFFARKFEEIVNQEVINHLDFKLYGEYPSHTPGLTSYWENCYDHRDGPSSLSDSQLSHYTSFARMGVADLNKQLGYTNEEHCSLELDRIYSVEIFKRSEQFSGYIVTIGATWGTKNPNDDGDNDADVKIQALVSHQNTFRMLDSTSSVASRLETAFVGTNWDVKELILRDWGGIIGPNCSPNLVARWRRGDENSVITVVVIDPLNVVADYSDFRTPSKSAGITQTPLSIRKPMRPGRWTVKFYVQRQFTKVFAEVHFFVAPLQFIKAKEGDQQLAVDNRGVQDDSQVNGASRNLYTIRTTLGLTKDLEALQSLVSNSAHLIGDRLKSWVDSVLGQAWKVKDVCYVSKASGDWKNTQPPRCRRQRQMTPNQCVNMNWSSFSPDPKSELGPVKADGRIR